MSPVYFDLLILFLHFANSSTPCFNGGSQLVQILGLGIAGFELD